MCSHAASPTEQVALPAISPEMVSDGILSRNSTEIELNNMKSATPTTLHSTKGAAKCYESHVFEMVHECDQQDSKRYSESDIQSTPERT